MNELRTKMLAAIEAALYEEIDPRHEAAEKGGERQWLHAVDEMAEGALDAVVRVLRESAGRDGAHGFSPTLADTATLLEREALT